MDDENVADWVVAIALGLVLVAVAWLLVSPSPGTGGGNAPAPSSNRQISLSAHYRLLDQMQRCMDVAAGRRGSGCLAASSAPSGSPSPSVRPLQRSARLTAVAVAPPPTQVPEPSAPATVAPATLPPSSPQPSPQPPAPALRPLPHNGPVPGGNTSPPHTGPRP
jgi:hypothetical protein